MPQELDYYDQPVSELFRVGFVKDGCFLAVKQNKQYKEWNPQEWKLWPEGENNE